MAIQNFSPLQLNSTFTVGVDDTGHDVVFYGATSGKKLTWDESDDSLYFADDTYLKLGNGGDVKMWHNGTDSYIMNLVGDLNILNSANDKDIILKSDDGSGGHTAYLTLDGSAGTVEVAKPMNVNGFAVGTCTSWILNNSVSGVAVSGSDKIYTITHGMGSSRNYGVQVIRNAANSGNGETVYTDVTRTDTTIVVTFALAPTAGDYTALVTKFPE